MDIVQTLHSGISAFQQHRFDEAEAFFKQVLDQEPDNFDALQLLGVLLLQTGRGQEGVTLLTKASQVKPEAPDIQNNLGNALAGLGREAEAIESYSAAIRLKPDFTEAYQNRAKLLHKQERFIEAVADYKQAIALKPDYTGAYNDCGNTLKCLQRLDEALACYDTALSLRPDFADAHYNRGNVLVEMKRDEEAIIAYARAAEIAPDFAEAYYGRGDAQKDLQRYEEALASYDAAIKLAPNHVKAHFNRGNALYALKHVDEAMHEFDETLAIAPNNAGTRFNKGMCLLSLGKLAEGWALYEWRKKNVPPHGARFFQQPLWTGRESLAGKTLFVYCEQGLGDTIQFCRYIKNLGLLGPKIIFAVPHSLEHFLRNLGPSVHLIGDIEAPGDFDFHVPLMSLPLAFHTTIETIPETTPYLCAEPDLIEKWRARLGDNGFKIGICWQGKDLALLPGRSFPVSEFAALSRLPNVRLISLQKDAGVEQLRALPHDLHIEELGDDFDAGPDAFRDTAAVMKSLDLVITLDSAAAHLAGALGIQTWVALKYVPDWRWLLEGRLCPWYKSLRLFRQKKRGDWNSVFTEMEQELRPMIEAQTKQSPAVQVSWGELIDKITILEIKNERIKNPAALANVARELALLQRHIAPSIAENEKVRQLTGELKSVNLALWDIEDSLRAKEKAQAFDPEFIERARSVYKQNDLRAALKKAINLELSSDIVEEKSYQAY